MLLPMPLDALGQRLDVSGVGVEPLDEPDFRRGGQGLHVGVQRVADAFRGAAGVLRVHRQHDDAGAARGPQFLERRRNRGRAVAHPVLHRDAGAGLGALAEQSRQELRLPGSVHCQRRALRRPDFGVLYRRLLRAECEDDPVQDGQPDEAREFDHPGVAEEFAQEAAHCSRGRCCRRAQVDEEDAGLHFLLPWAAIACGALRAKAS